MSLLATFSRTGLHLKSSTMPIMTNPLSFRRTMTLDRDYEAESVQILKLGSNNNKNDPWIRKRICFLLLYDPLSHLEGIYNVCG